MKSVVQKGQIIITFCQTRCKRVLTRKQWACWRCRGQSESRQPCSHSQRTYPECTASTCPRHMPTQPQTITMMLIMWDSHNCSLIWNFLWRSLKGKFYTLFKQDSQDTVHITQPIALKDWTTVSEPLNKSTCQPALTVKNSRILSREKFYRSHALARVVVSVMLPTLSPYCNQMSEHIITATYM